MQPAIQYAKSGEVNIAYLVTGQGPDLVFVPGWVSNVGLSYQWEFVERLSRFCRVILFDKRGTGMSDRHVGAATMEERMDGVRAVMDAAGTPQASLFGISEGGSLAMLFTATYPERVRSLALFGSFAKRIWSPDYPWAPTPEKRQKFLAPTPGNSTPPNNPIQERGLQPATDSRTSVRE